MTHADFAAIQNFALARGAVARQLNQLVLVVTSPEYAAQNETLSGVPAATEPLPLVLEGGGNGGSWARNVTTTARSASCPPGDESL